MPLIETWIPYQEGNKIYYSNQSNQIDSIEVTSIENTFGKIGHHCVAEIETVEMNIKGNQITNLRVSLNDYSIIFDLNVDNSYKLYQYKLDESTSHVFDTPDFYSNIELGDSNYNDVLGLKLDSIKVFYGKSIGVIGYKISEDTFIKD